MTSMGGYAAVGTVAAVTTTVATPIVRRLAWRFHWVAAAGERRVHTEPTPDVGGIAMFLGFMAAMVVAWRLDVFHGIFSSNNSEPLGVVLGAAVIFVCGLLDDLFELSAPAKVTGILVAGVVLAYFGVTMYFFRIPFLGVVYLGQDLSPLLTVLWLMVMANAINLVDGLDGLAAGIVAIASGTFFLYSERLESAGKLTQVPPNIGPLIAIIVLGICVGFLPHNFNPARIFMGDSGALLLGLLMAVSTAVVGGRADPDFQQFSGQTYFFFAPLFIPLVILGVPIVDTLFAIIRRARRRRGIALPDKEHLHHRLMRLGHGQRRSVLILWLWTALLSGLVLYPTYTNEGNALVPFGIAALALGLYTILHPGRHRVATDAEQGAPLAAVAGAEAGGADPSGERHQDEHVELRPVDRSR
jgi:UDP-GlcNAc:undecaprenyl-phosphate/decaprenyl-phosphate GlcNAc-1-phosphate transferase